MEEKKKGSEALLHQLVLTNRGQLALEGVISLGSYDQDRIMLETSAGVLEIKGSSLNIQQLNLDLGKVMIDGEVYSLVYTDENALKKGFFGRLIK